MFVQRYWSLLLAAAEREYFGRRSGGTVEASEVLEQVEKQKL